MFKHMDGLFSKYVVNRNDLFSTYLNNIPLVSPPAAPSERRRARRRVMLISSKYVEFIHGKFEDKADILFKKYGKFDFVWFDCGGVQEYQTFMQKYWDICSGYIFFHFTYKDGSPNLFHDIILDSITGSPFIFDIVEPHKKRQGSITMVKKNDYANKQKTRAK